MGYIVIVQLFVMIQWMWRKLMLFILFLCVNGVPTTCVYAELGATSYFVTKLRNILLLK